MHFPEDIAPYLPENTIGLIRNYWKKYPFEFKITGHRNTKHGDYRYIPKGDRHLISVNKSLNPHQFLFTLVHEIAHQWVKIRYRKRQSPHGSAWKEMFRNLIDPFIHLGVFPEDLNREIVRHMKNPKATSSSDASLYHAFQEDNGSTTYLKDLEEGAHFAIGKRHFVKGPKRRTRYLCYALPDNRKYTISPIAPVISIASDAS